MFSVREKNIYNNITLNRIITRYNKFKNIYILFYS